MDLLSLYNQIPKDPLQLGWWFFLKIGWIYPVGLFCYGLVLGWLGYVRGTYRRSRRYILLAIDIPKDNEQGPKAVENVFQHLAGAHQDIKILQKWWDGEIPDSFSLEIVSLGGYIQFIVHLCDRYRDLIEAIIYAQYPNAEITEVEDYTAPWHIKFPNDQYELWGTEIILAKPDVYPIRTFREFEDTLVGEYKDTMASFLEGLSRIGPHEQVWIQLVVTPADNDWGDHGKHVVDKIISRRNPHAKKNLADRIFEFPFQAIDTVVSTTNQAPATEHAREEPPTQMLHLTPGEKAKVEGIELKVSKIGFHVKIHAIYLAEKPYFKKGFGLNVVYGGFKQFNASSNGFKPAKRTYTGGLRYFKKTRLAWRKNKIFHHYKVRGHWYEPGYYGEVLNTEELATVWHFPIMTVKAPLVKKTESRKAEPPITLPVEQPVLIPKSPIGAAQGGPPGNLPTIEEEPPL